jgi:putative transposase
MKSHYATISNGRSREVRPFVWVPNYRKRILTGPVALRTRDLLRQIVTENDLHIISGKVAADHVHMFLSYRAHQNISQIVQWLKGTSSRVLFHEFPHLKKHSARRPRSRKKGCAQSNDDAA